VRSPELVQTAYINRIWTERQKNWLSIAGKERVCFILHNVTLALESTHIQGKAVRLHDSEDGRTKPHRNVGNYLPANTTQVLDDLTFNPLNAKLNPICHLLALLGAHHILHVSRIRVKNCASYI
jgi:hypothetical protein